jgi:hypothetical protein
LMGPLISWAGATPAATMQRKALTINTTHNLVKRERMTTPPCDE